MTQTNNSINNGQADLELPAQTEISQPLEESKTEMKNKQFDTETITIAKKYKKYSIGFKLQVLETKDKHGIYWASNKHQVPIGTIRTWINFSK